jgi:hypothetical protein
MRHHNTYEISSINFDQRDTHCKNEIVTTDTEAKQENNPIL